MPLIRLGNARAALVLKGIDPMTNEGNNALVNLALDIVPTCQSVGFIDSEDVIEIFYPYEPPARVTELGEVLTIDHSYG